MNNIISAAMNGQTEFIRKLISTGNNINITDKDSQNALMLAITNGHIETAEFLINHILGLDAVNCKKCTAAMLAAAKGLNEIISLLISKGANPNIAGSCGTALTQAASNGHFDTVKLLIDDYDVDVNTGILLKHSALNLKDYKTPLMCASEKGYIKIVEFLLERGAFYDATDAYKNTALLYSIINHHTDVVRILAHYGADLNIVDIHGRTALMYAAECGYLDILGILLECGADKRIKDNKGKTVFLYARASNKKGLFKLLKNNYNEEQFDEEEANNSEDITLDALSQMELNMELHGSGLSTVILEKQLEKQMEQEEIENEATRIYYEELEDK